MTEKQLAEIKERVAKAMVGDWDYDVGDKDISNGNFMVLRADISPDGYPIVCARDEDLDFITQAREDVPELIAEVERLQAEIERLHSDLESHTDAYYHEDVRKACTWILEDSQRRLDGEALGIDG